MHFREASIRFCVACGIASTLCYGLVTVIGGGNWPGTWPKELEPFRDKAKTIEVMHGVQETYYEITFHSADEFEKVWPFILALKSKGAPLIIEKSPSQPSVSGSSLAHGVCIKCPPAGTVVATTGGKESSLDFNPPWPESILSTSGDLPEYVVADGERWIPYTKDGDFGFRYRVRTEIVLVADGKIIDLNRIELPEDTPILDHRFKE